MADSPDYRAFESFLRSLGKADRASRKEALLSITCWLAWAEELTARVPYVYLDVVISTRRWPVRWVVVEEPAAEEMTRPDGQAVS